MPHQAQRSQQSNIIPYLLNFQASQKLNHAKPSQTKHQRTAMPYYFFFVFFVGIWKLQVENTHKKRQWIPDNSVYARESRPIGWHWPDNKRQEHDCNVKSMGKESKRCHVRCQPEYWPVSGKFNKNCTTCQHMHRCTHSTRTAQHGNM